MGSYALRWTDCDTGLSDALDVASEAKSGTTGCKFVSVPTPVAVTMANEGRVEIRQGGRAVDPNGVLRGPIRIGRPASQGDDVRGTPG